MGGLLLLGLLGWLFIRHRRSKKSDYTPGQDEIRWPEVSEPAELFPAAATRVGGHGLDEPDAGGGAAGGAGAAAAGAGLGGGLKDIDDDEELSHGSGGGGGYGRNSDAFPMSDMGHYGNGAGYGMSDAGHSATTGWSSNAAGVGAAAAGAGAGAGAYYNNRTSESHSSPQQYDQYGQRPQTYEAPRHASYVGAQGGHDWADYEAAYAHNGYTNSSNGHYYQQQQQSPPPGDRLSNPYEGIDDDTGSIADDRRESVASNGGSGGGRLGVVNL